MTNNKAYSGIQKNRPEKYSNNTSKNGVCKPFRNKKSCVSISLRNSMITILLAAKLLKLKIKN